MLVEDVSRNKCFFRFEYHIFYVLYPFVTYLLTLPHIYKMKLSCPFPVSYRGPNTEYLKFFRKCLNILANIYNSRGYVNVAVEFLNAFRILMPSFFCN
jgi:hypothetical protein